MQQKWIRWMTHRNNFLAIVPILGFLESSYTGKYASCQNIDIGWPVILLLFYIVLYFSDIQSIYLLQQKYFSRNCIKCATHRTNLSQHWQQIIMLLSAIIFLQWVRKFSNFGEDCREHVIATSNHIWPTMTMENNFYSMVLLYLCLVNQWDESPIFFKRL